MKPPGGLQACRGGLEVDRTARVYDFRKPTRGRYVERSELCAIAVDRASTSSTSPNFLNPATPTRKPVDDDQVGVFDPANC